MCILLRVVVLFLTVDLTTSTAATTAVAVNDVKSASMEPPAAKRARTEESSPANTD